jgi:hypothetical protein
MNNIFEEEYERDGIHIGPLFSMLLSFRPETRRRIAGIEVVMDGDLGRQFVGRSFIAAGC